MRKLIGISLLPLLGYLVIMGVYFLLKYGIPCFCFFLQLIEIEFIIWFSSFLQDFKKKTLHRILGPVSSILQQFFSCMIMGFRNGEIFYIPQLYSVAPCCWNPRIMYSKETMKCGSEKYTGQKMWK